MSSLVKYTQEIKLNFSIKYSFLSVIDGDELAADRLIDTIINLI